MIPLSNSYFQCQRLSVNSSIIDAKDKTGSRDCVSCPRFEFREVDRMKVEKLKIYWLTAHLHPWT